MEPLQGPEVYVNGEKRPLRSLTIKRSMEHPTLVELNGAFLGVCAVRFGERRQFTNRRGEPYWAPETIRIDQVPWDQWLRGEGGVMDEQRSDDLPPLSEWPVFPPDKMEEMKAKLESLEAMARREGLTVEEYLHSLKVE
jgi:hypothetical protein